MDQALLEYLLNENESNSLDFKRDQYPLTTEEEKGELLKDIIAFANSWKRTDAYILIGANELKTGGGEAVGIQSHLSDSHLQQMVNSKTNKPLTFSYEAVTYKSLQIGVLHIPIQDRPFWLNRKFGKLEADKAYIRRGSSTAVASLDEITKMVTLVLNNNSALIELRALASELDYFINTKVEDWYAKSKAFLSDQYQRVFNLGIISSLSEELRNSLQEIYAEIRNIDKICQAGWGGGERTRPSSLNEARSRFLETLPKAKEVRNKIEEYLQNF